MTDDLIERLRAYITQREKIRDGGITITECNGVPLTLTDLREAATALESNAPVGVGGLPRYGFPDGNEPRPVPCTDGYWTPWHLAQALRNEAHATAAKDAEIEELRADLADYMRIANTEATRAERLAEALRYAVDNPDFDSERFDALARAALEQEGKNDDV